MDFELLRQNIYDDLNVINDRFMAMQQQIDQLLEDNANLRFAQARFAEFEIATKRALVAHTDASLNAHQRLGKLEAKADTHEEEIFPTYTEYVASIKNAA